MLDKEAKKYIMKKTLHTGIENGISKNSFQIYTIIFFYKDHDKCISKHT